MPKVVQSVERAAAILRLLAVESEPLSLGEVAAAMGLAKGTVHGLVATLREAGLVEQDPITGCYRVGRDLFLLGAEPVDVNELRCRALNWTDALAAWTGEAAHLAVFRGGRGVVAHHVFRADGSRDALATGSDVPLHACALGKVLSAFDPGAARTVLGGPLESHTYRTITDRGRLLRELAEVRDRGWAAGIEEIERGVASIAAPVRERGGYMIAAVGVRGPVDALCDGHGRPRAEIVEQVLRAGRSVSRAFGHRPRR